VNQAKASQPGQAGIFGLKDILSARALSRWQVVKAEYRTQRGFLGQVPNIPSGREVNYVEILDTEVMK
jgi:hypothetical protein